MAVRFQKPKLVKEWMKIGIYAKAGGGKTFTALLFAEELAKKEGRRVAYIDTEKSTAFYVRDVPERKIHPKAFDIDLLETKSIFDALEAVEELDPNVHSVVVVDSISAMWDAAKAAYQGKLTSKGGIPITAWEKIKRPYKKLISLLLDGPFYVILCGREGVQTKDNGDDGFEVVGAKMRAEGETAFEPHMLIRMVPEREDDGTHRIRAFFEKDRSGILEGRTIDWPTYETIAASVGILDGTGAATRFGDPDEIAARDAEAAERRAEAAEAERTSLYVAIRDAITAAKDINELKAAWSLTAGKKTKLGADHMENLEIAKETQKVELLGRVA